MIITIERARVIFEFITLNQPRRFSMNFQHLGFEYEVSYSKFVDETSLQIVKACAGKGRRYGNVGRVEIYKSMVEFAEAYGLKGL